MGKKTESTSGSSSSKVTIGKAGADELAIREQLAAIIRDAAPQFGNLSELAGGRISFTQDDQSFLDQITKAQTDMERRERADLRLEGSRALDQSLGARGMEGSSIEAVERAIMERDLMRRSEDSSSKRQMLAAQLPYQRAEAQMGANRLLLERLLGAANPALQASLSERLAQTKQYTQSSQKTETSGATVGELAGSFSMTKEF